MSVKPYNAFEINKLVKYYRNIPDLPKTSQALYLDDSAMMAGLYINSISNLEDFFRHIFVFSEYKKQIDIKQAQIQWRWPKPKELKVYWLILSS